jgi:hypothetical protein
LEQRIENQIVQRTWGRIHRLQVELADDRIVVHGQTSSYYAKQLALEGVLDVIGSTAPTSVDLDIQVGADTHGRMLYAPVRAERAI